jgi:16S rRNA U516 pseudouridylate synthase RsuA-like enzyme
MSEKLQKVLARAGHGSRREIESIIAAGRVSVDGKIATLGDRVEVTPGLKIRIDGHLISVKESAEQICRVLAITSQKANCVPVTTRKVVRPCLIVYQNCVMRAGLP